MRRLTIVLVVLMATLLLSGCMSTSKRLQGYWKLADAPAGIWGMPHLASDKTYTWTRLDDKSYRNSQDGIWDVKDGVLVFRGYDSNQGRDKGYNISWECRFTLRGDDLFITIGKMLEHYERM